ncbi:MAG: oligosaccharide flippase family protein [Candidatus Schekmanbacteria bacterium]|nr:oligosaccharide flippase family protein [Candidatus Schekmanbacteria bacterium]
MLEILKKLGKHSAIYACSDILEKSIGFLLIPLYTKYLSPADYGIIELLSINLNMMILISVQGMTSSFFRAYSFDWDNDIERKEVVTTAYFYTVFSAFVIFSLLYLLSEKISIIVFSDSKYNFLLSLTFISGFFRVSTYIPFQVLRANSKSITFSIINFTQFLIGVSLNIFFVVYQRLGANGVFYANVIVSITTSLITFIVIKKHIIFSFSFDKLKRMLSFGLPYVPSGIFLWIITVSDRFFIQYYSSQTELGLYSLSYKFSKIADLLFVNPFMLVWPSIYFPLAKEKNARESFSKFMNIYSLFIAFGGLGLILFTGPVIHLITPKAFWRANDAVFLIVSSSILYGVLFVLNVGIEVTRKTKLNVITIGSSAFFNLLLNYLLIPSYGMMGAAVATFASYVFMIIVAQKINEKYYPIKYDWNKVFKVVFAFTVSISLSFIIKSENILNDFLCKLLLLSIYPIILYFLKYFSIAEIKSIRELSFQFIEKFKLKVT